MQPTTVSGTVGVLILEYGEPTTIDEVEPFLQGHFGGQTPPADYVAFLCDRCRRVWGGDQGQSGAGSIFSALAAQLAEPGTLRYHTVMGARYWHPTIGVAIDELSRAGITDVVVLPLSPFASHMSLRDYQHALEEIRATHPLRIHLIEGWAELPGFVAAITANAEAALNRFPAEVREQVAGLFIVHSVAESTRKPEDGYRDQLARSSSQLATALGLKTSYSAYYSAEGPGQWLGPDVLEALDQMHADGVRHVLAVPVSGVYDNVELSYELDVRMAEHAVALGMTYERAALPNAAPVMINDLTQLIGETSHKLLATQA